MLKKKQKGIQNKALFLNRFFIGSVYAKVNTYLAGIGILIFIYSGIFSPTQTNHPIPSMYSFPVASTGLSRAFSAILRGEIQITQQFNPFALSIFIFFLVQIVQRVLVNLLLALNRISKNLLLYTDILLSVLLFLWAFKNLVLFQISSISRF